MSDGYREAAHDLLDDSIRELYVDRIIYDHPYDWDELSEAFKAYRKLEYKTGQVALPASASNDLKKISDSLYMLAFTPLSARSIPGLSDARKQLDDAFAGEFVEERQRLETALDNLFSCENPCYEAVSGAIAMGDGDDTCLILRNQDEIDLVEENLKQDALYARYLRDNASARTANLYRYGLLFTLPEYFAFHKIDKGDRAKYVGWLISAPPCEELHVFHFRMFGDFEVERYAPWPGYEMPEVIADSSLLAGDQDNGSDFNNETEPDENGYEQEIFDFGVDDEELVYVSVEDDERGLAVELGRLLGEYWNHQDR
ncbi:hypothetical protein AL0467_1092 [Bifidobacterium adolescentis]|uniref:Uncharacterized protein n=1 Tax=Bifidobacterium adolescentis TaxID=1680 RepID=A0A1X3A246_BIFAD|nr:hypothetical protein AL0467_1092 [Bifidobacterium adolescentis]